MIMFKMVPLCSKAEVIAQLSLILMFTASESISPNCYNKWWKKWRMFSGNLDFIARVTHSPNNAT